MEKKYSTFMFLHHHTNFWFRRFFLRMVAVTGNHSIDNNLINYISVSIRTLSLQQPQRQAIISLGCCFYSFLLLMLLRSVSH